LTYAYAIFTWKRPIEFGAMCALLFILFSIFIWLDLTVVSIFFLLLNGVIWFWWVTELVTFKFPWEKLLGKDPDPNDAYNLIIFLHSKLNSTLYSNQPNQIIGILFAISFVGYYANGTLLFFVFLFGLLCSPGLANLHIQKLKEQQKKNS